MNPNLLNELIAEAIILADCELKGEDPTAAEGRDYVGTFLAAPEVADTLSFLADAFGLSEVQTATVLLEMGLIIYVSALAHYAYEAEANG